jgi:hypothetical protein
MRYTPPHQTLSAVYRPSTEAQAARVVLAYPRVMFHPCTCGLHGGATTVAATLIGYDDRGGCYWETREPKMIVIDYFLYTDARLCWITAPTLLSLLSASSGNDDL